MSENREIYTAGKKIYTAAGTDGMDKFHLWSQMSSLVLFMMMAIVMVMMMITMMMMTMKDDERKPFFQRWNLSIPSVPAAV